METRARSGPHDMKEEDVWDGIVLALIWLWEGGKGNSRTLVKDIAPMRCSYDFEFRNLAADHKIGFGDDLNEKVYFFLANLPYNV